jgi:hypothetical protein
MKYWRKLFGRSTWFAWIGIALELWMIAEEREDRP